MAASQRILLGHIKGEKGDTGTITVGPVTPGAPGSNPQVTATGTPEDRQLNFTLPTTPVINVGTVTASAPGTQPQVTMTGPAATRSLNFTLPRGETGPGGGITPLRSHIMPLVYRLPFTSPASPQRVLGAMDTLRWDEAPEHPWTTGFVYYFTTHPTQGIMRGWNRTASDPRVALTEVISEGMGTPLERPMFTFRNCPINFNTAGYRGNWSRQQMVTGTNMGAGATGQYDDSVWRVRNWEFDGLAFTNTNQALWVRGRDRQGTQNYSSPGLELQVITLQGLPVGQAMTAMWAGKSPTDNWIWVIMQNTLFRMHLLNSESGHVAGLGGDPLLRTITGAADLPFAQVTDPALPTTMSRVYAEGRYAAVWGTAPANRIAYYDGNQWYALTAPFNFVTGQQQNNVVIYPNGLLGVYNPSTGNYYTCNNPTSPPGTFTLRYATIPYALMTDGFMRGIPQFMPRGNYGFLYSEFGPTSDDTGTGFVNPRGPTTWADMYWPNELYCSTGRPDVVPSQAAAHGYAFPWATLQTSGSLLGDNLTTLLTGFYSPNHVADYPMPPNLQPAWPRRLITGTKIVGPAVVRDDVNRHVSAIYVSYP